MARRILIRMSLLLSVALLTSATTVLAAPKAERIVIPEPPAAPEPSVYIMLAAGLLVGGGYAIYRHRKAKSRSTTNS